MTLYSKNAWTNMTEKKTKVYLHLILQIIGTALILVGFSLNVEDIKSGHFETPHEIFGLISVIFLLITFVNGLLAFFALDIKQFVKPVYNKLFHTTFSVIVFVTGMISLILGYHTNFMKSSIGEDYQHHITWLSVGTGLSLVLSAPGVYYTIYHQVVGFLRK